MCVKILFPPRPKGKMLSSDLPFYESTGKWVAQRKFRGSRIVIYISTDRKITVGNRHGRQFSKFSLEKSFAEEILSVLSLEEGLDYWLDGELMNKDKNATNEIILFDILQAGRYFFSKPQLERLELLDKICGFPQKLCRQGFALEVSTHLWLAQKFTSNFSDRFDESLPVPQLEGLVLRKKLAGLDNFGDKEYETANLIRCRKPFRAEKPEAGRSGGYEF
jgi:hypothetical protein